MKESPQPLSSSEMRAQLQRFAEINSTSQAARAARYEMGLQHPEYQPHSVSVDQPVPLDISQPVAENDWHCSRCGARFDGSSLKIYNSRFAFGGQNLAMCPHCGGASYSLHQETLRQAEELSLQKTTRTNNLRNGIICGAALALFLLTPSSWTYLLCWIAAFWFGPLTAVHLKMKLGAVVAIMWIGVLFRFVVPLTGMGHLTIVSLWLGVTVVLVAAGWLIEKVAAFGGGLFYKG